MRHCLFIFLILVVAEFSAQTASIVFENSNKEPYQITINHIQQHQNFANSIKLNGLKGEMPYNVKIHFKNDTTIIKKNIYLIDEGLTHIYAVTKKDLLLKKIVPAASYPKTANQLMVNYILNNDLPLDTLPKDTLQEKDTAYVVPFASYYKLEDYEGRIGCPFPIKELEQAELRGIILNESLEESKLEKVKTALLEMDSACVLIEQTKELLVLFEFEETRLNFAQFMFAYTFDLDHYAKLNDAFNFEESKAQLKQLYGKK